MIVRRVVAVAGSMIGQGVRVEAATLGVVAKRLIVLSSIGLVAIGAPLLLASTTRHAARGATRPTAAAPPVGGDYSFLLTVPGGGPVTFQCGSTIDVEYNPAGEPYDASGDVAADVTLLADGMHRRVTYVGTTSETTDAFRAAPPKTATILIGWVPAPGDLPSTASTDTLGEGGPITSGNHIIGGAIDLVANARLQPGLGPDSFGAVALHELGHAVDLGHVTDPAEQMNPTLQPDRPAGWGPGDLRGLAALGAACR